MVGPDRQLGALVGDVEPGELLCGRYRLLDELGRGGMARVFRARDERIGREVAVKTLAPGLALEPCAFERFRDEARVVGAMTHPHIVPLFDVGTDRGRPFMVLQLIDGPSLEEALREGPLAIHEAVRIATEIAEALECAHGHSLLHGDVKPHNVLLAREPGGGLGPAMLADFGVARALERTRSQRQDDEPLYGSLPYVAPELLLGAGERVGPAADLYGLGVVLYRMLTGRLPFPERNADELVARRVNGEPAPVRRLRPEVTPELDAVVQRALRRDPSARYRDATELRLALRAAQAEPAAASETRPTTYVALPGRGVRLPRPRLRVSFRGWLLALPVLALVALVAIHGLSLPTLPAVAADTVEVPTLAGQSLADARSSAAAAGLTLQSDEQATLDTPAGLVVTQDPREGSRAARGSTVRAVVSSGVRVPEIVGRQCRAARSELAGRGWQVRAVRWRFANTPDFGTIVQQDPAPGTVVASKGQITVQVAGPVAPC